MIEFYVAVEGGYAPRSADASAFGSLPTDGFRYCEPVRTASRFGWYIFLPYELSVIWEEDNVFWSLDGFETRHILANAIQYPGFSAEFDAAAPPGTEGYSPPFLSRTNDDAMLQIWTGLFARTRPDIGLWVRSPVNLSQQLTFHVLEGVVETDWWFGPLLANLKMTQRDTPIIFRKERPFLQVLPFDRALGLEAKDSEPVVRTGLDTLTDTEWEAYTDTVVRKMKSNAPAGDYAAAVRKKRR